MRFASFIAALLISAAATIAATSNAIVVTPWQVGNSRPAFTGKINAGIAIGQNDTLMIAASGNDTTGGGRRRYSPLAPSAFWTQVPTTYEYVSSNKDSLILFITAIRVDADTGDATVILQGLAYGDTTAPGYPSRGTFVTLGSANLPNTAAATRTRLAFANPGVLGFRFRVIGATATDTTRVFRAEIYDK